MHERVKVTCPIPRTNSDGGQECPACGLRWDQSDGRPECDRQRRGVRQGPRRPTIPGKAYREAKGL